MPQEILKKRPAPDSEDLEPKKSRTLEHASAASSQLQLQTAEMSTRDCVKMFGKVLLQRGRIEAHRVAKKFKDLGKKDVFDSCSKVLNYTFQMQEKITSGDYTSVYKWKEEVIEKKTIWTKIILLHLSSFIVKTSLPTLINQSYSATPTYPIYISKEDLPKKIKEAVKLVIDLGCISHIKQMHNVLNKYGKELLSFTEDIEEIRNILNTHAKSKNKHAESNLGTTEYMKKMLDILDQYSQQEQRKTKIKPFLLDEANKLEKFISTLESKSDQDSKKLCAASNSDVDDAAHLLVALSGDLVTYDNAPF